MHRSLARFANFLAPLLLVACSCNRNKTPKPAPSAEKSAQPSAMPAPSASAPERRAIAEREPLDAASTLAPRKEVVERLDQARELLGKNEARQALEALKPLREKDPLGGAVALTLARAALAADETAVAERAARFATTAMVGTKALADAQHLLGQTLDKLGRKAEAIVALSAAVAADPKRTRAKSDLDRLQKAEPAGPVASAAPPEAQPIPDRREACSRLESAVQAGKGDLGADVGAAATEVKCDVEFSLDVGSKTLVAAHALKVDARVSGDGERLVWVALETDKGIKLFGPVTRVTGVGVQGAVNDAVVDLQKIDILPGGAPEVVAKVVERRTLPDVALAEVVYVDETRATLLTVDHGPLQASREVVLSSDVRRERVGEKAKSLPHGFSSSAPFAANYAMKVGWGASNEMTLTKSSGNAKPKVEGSITLF